MNNIEIIFRDNRKTYINTITDLIYNFNDKEKENIKNINVIKDGENEFKLLILFEKDIILKINFSYLYIKHFSGENNYLYCKNINNYDKKYDNINLLYLNNCNLENIPKNIFKKLRVLTINNCNIKDDYFNDLDISNILSLNILNCKLNKISNNFNLLKYLKIENSNIKDLPNDLNNLEELELYKCNDLKNIPNYLLSIKLIIKDCNNIKH